MVPKISVVVVVSVVGVGEYPPPADVCQQVLVIIQGLTLFFLGQQLPREPRGLGTLAIILGDCKYH